MSPNRIETECGGVRRRDALILLAMLAFAGCARTPRVPLKPNDVQRIGIISISEAPADGSAAPFNPALFAEPRRGGNPQYSLLGLAIDAALQARHNSIQADRFAFTTALGALGFLPKVVLTQALSRQIEARSLPISKLDNPAAEQAFRQGRYEDLPQHVNALLEIQIREAGYYSSSRAGGFTPYFDIVATLWDTVNPVETIDSFGYYGDFRDPGKDKRYFKTPPELSVADSKAFAANPDRFRAGLTAVFERVATMLLDDVERCE